MVSAECSTPTTETTTEPAVSENLPTTIVGQSSVKDGSVKGSESAPQEKKSGNDEEAKVAGSADPPEPQPVSVPSSAAPSAVSSPSASGSVSASGSPSRRIAPPVAGSVSVPTPAAAAAASISQPPLNGTGPSPSPPVHPQNPSTAQSQPMQVKSLSPLPPTHPPMQPHAAHPLHPQGHPPVYPVPVAPHYYHPAHVYHPHYPPMHPHMYHPAMWHHPPPPPHHHHHPSNPAAYIKPYSAVMRSQPHIKRTSKYMLMEQGGTQPSPTAQGSSRSPVPREVESSSEAAADKPAEEETKEEETTKRPASEMSNSSEKEKEDVPEDLRNKKMKATDCLLFAASLLSADQKKAQEAGTDANDSSAAGVDDSEYTTTGVRPAKKIFQAPIAAEDDEDGERDENWPKDVDVLCGRGGLINKHPGNVVYRKIVDYNKPFYQSVHKKHRILVSQSIVQSILNFGGRFMTMEKGKEWSEIEFKRAVQKTSQALRERIIPDGEVKKEEEEEDGEEETNNGESKSAEGDEGMGEGEDDVDNNGNDKKAREVDKEELVVKSENISDNANGIAKGAVAV